MDCSIRKNKNRKRKTILTVRYFLLLEEYTREKLFTQKNIKGKILLLKIEIQFIFLQFPHQFKFQTFVSFLLLFSIQPSIHKNNKYKNVCTRGNYQKLRDSKL